MSGLLPLRPYQSEALDAIESDWQAGTARPACVLPTGSGKTVVFAHGAARYRRRRPDRRVLAIAHRTELIEQAANKIRSVAPALSVGIVKAERNQTLADVVVASVQTLRNERRRRQLLDVGLVIIDECHHATADSYVRVLEHFGCMEDRDATLAVGFTATMTRGDDAALGSIWQKVSYSRSIAEMIRDGYLVRPVGKRVYVEDLDFSKVRKLRGDYSEHDLGEALESSMAPEAIARAYLEHAADRPGILFAPTVSSAATIAAALCAAGIPTGLVHGETPAAERRQVLEDFEAGRLQVLANCMVLTEGFDSPKASCVVIARPTCHKGLYVQMVGRVLRPFPGKSNALVLDVTGASQRHALTSAIELFGEEPKAPGDEREPDETEELEEITLDDTGIGGGADEPLYVDGELVSVDVDLFHGSESAWLRTYGGTWFVPAGDRYIAIVPAMRPGAWDVVAMHRYQHGQSRWVIRDVDELSYAMAWAESDISPVEHMLARKDRKWRANRPSPAQTALAQRNGIIVSDDMLSGEVSNLIAMALASRRIDPFMPAYARR